MSNNLPRWNPWYFNSGQVSSQQSHNQLPPMDGAGVACWFASSQRCVCRMVGGSGTRWRWRDGGAQKTRKSNIIQLFFPFPHLSQYPKCGIFWKRKNTTLNWLSTSFSFLYIFQDLFLQLGTAMRVWTLDPNSRVGSSDMTDHMCLFFGGLFIFITYIESILLGL